MRVLNLRLGFATNSSSSHSIIVLRSGKEAAGLAASPAYDSYGWENFTLNDRQNKRTYMASQLGGALGYDPWGDDAAVTNARIIGEIAELLGYSDFGMPTYVDHQSEWQFPGTFDDPLKPDPGFVRAMAEFLDRPTTVVLGGNDNSDGHPLVENDYLDRHKGPYHDRLWHYPYKEGRGGSVVCRDDGTHWVLFDRRSGAKARVIFDEPMANARFVFPPAKTPELADIKITDYCPFGCTFCYQDSTPKGKHATMPQIRKVVKHLAEAKVFEVAIGGGEPTLHPHFLEILKAFRAAGIVPNFTTRNLKWLGPRKAKPILEAAGAFAYSTHSLADVEEFAAACKQAGVKNEWNHKQAVIHIVMGTVTRAEFRKMLKRAGKSGLGVTLLGWKAIGRADKTPTHPYLDWWLPVTKEVGMWSIGIDTTLAAEAEAAGQLVDYPSWMYHTKDGLYSCYVDAVAQTMAPSSWEPQRGAWPLNEGLAAFAGGWS